jgi:undecaprenyl-diphosphatase
MTQVITAVVLGFIQGLTEFLPISSSGHLVIFQHLFQFQGSPVAFDVVLHLGTLVAIAIYFGPTLRFIKPKTIGLVVVGTIPAVLVALLTRHLTETAFQSLTVVGIGLLITSGMLLLTQKLKIQENNFNQMKLKDAIVIGIVQAVAITPGISRSGSTIVAGLKQGLNRDTAVIYSFYLAVPAILGAFVLELPQIINSASRDYLSLGLGFVSAILGGLGSIVLIKKVVKEMKLYYFGYYCLVVGSITLIWSLIQR